MKWIKDLFQEDSKVSMVRVMALIGLLTACYLAIVGKDVAVVSTFVTASFGSKILQKHIETRAAK